MKMKKLPAFAALLWISSVHAAPADDVDCNNCVDASDVSANAIAGRHLKDGVVSADKIANRTISQQKIGPKAISTGKIQNGAVNLKKLAPEVLELIGGMQAQITAMDAYIQQLQAYIEVDETTKPAQPVVRVVAANLQVVNGEGRTNSINGTGNLIVGYDEVQDVDVPPACTDGRYTSQFKCLENDEVWGLTHKSVSHNLVVVYAHSYGQFGGFVAGIGNTINRGYTSVSGGTANAASGFYSSVSGGANNNATEIGASVSGGWYNTASGFYSSVSGGELNAVSGSRASVSGGLERSAEDNYDWVAGSLLEDD
jgi:hypothetical protein